MALVPSPYDHPRRNGRSAKKTMFLIVIQSGTVRYYFQRNLIYKKILSRIFLPLLFRDSTYYMGTPREVSEYGHFVFFLPIIKEPWGINCLWFCVQIISVSAVGSYGFVIDVVTKI